MGKKHERSTLDSIKFKDEIVIGVKDDSKPFGYVENGKLKGFDIEISDVVAKRILNSEESSKIRFKVLSPEEKIFALNSKDVDMVIAVMSITPSRLEIIDFSQPYYVAGLSILANKKARINGVSDLNDKNVAVILGTTGEQTLRHLAPSAKIRGAKTYPESFELLKKGEVDAVFADDSLLYGFVMDNKNYKILPKRYSEEYYAIAIRKGDKRLQNTLNTIIDELHQSGELARMRQKWLRQFNSGTNF